MKIKLLFLMLCVQSIIHAQNVGINNTDPQAALDLSGSLRTRHSNVNIVGNSATIPDNVSYAVMSCSGNPVDRVISASSSVQGRRLVIDNRNCDSRLELSTVLGPLYINSGEVLEFIVSPTINDWTYIGKVNTEDWGIYGNEGTDPANNFLGTTDDQPLKLRLNNNPYGGLHPEGDILIGSNAGNALTRIEGSHIGIGKDALKNAVDADQGAIAIGDSTLMSNTIGANQAMGQGINNIAIGMKALKNNTTGGRNIAIGQSSQINNLGGSYNTSLGSFSLGQNIGSFNLALGGHTMQNNYSGNANIAIGYETMYSNLNGSGNIAIGLRAMKDAQNKDGIIAIGDSTLLNNGIGATIPEHGTDNVAIGGNALQNNNLGYQNTAVGYEAMKANTTGVVNTAVGYRALRNNINGVDNTALGNSALRENISGVHNIAVGEHALLTNTTGENNVVVGGHAAQNSNGSNNVIIGDKALYNTANTASGVVAVGNKALYHNTVSNVVAIGDSSLFNNSISAMGQQGSGNTAIGNKSLFGNTIGSYNTALGSNALMNNVNGSYNIGIGYYALSQGIGERNDNIAIGVNAMQFSQHTDQCIAIGKSALVYSDPDPSDPNPTSNVAIGYETMRGAFNGADHDGTNNVAIGKRALFNYETGSRNVGIGEESLYNISSASDNVSIGYKAMFHNKNKSKSTALGAFAMHNMDNSTAASDVFSTAVGYGALYGSPILLNNTGVSNTAVGYLSLQNNSSGSFNTASGVGALQANGTASNNTAFGFQTINANITGVDNTAMGYQALRTNVAKNGNTAIGAFSMTNANSSASTSNSANTAVGYASLRGSVTPANNTGTNNTAIGHESMINNTSGNNNTALGKDALKVNTIGFNNVAIGALAGDSIASNLHSTFIGYDADCTPGGNGNVWFSTAIGYSSRVTADNQIRLGRSSTTSIGGFQNWSNISDGRYKENVKEDVVGLDFIKKLRPVTYTLKIEALNEKLGVSNEEPSRSSKPKSQQILSGFIAQEVESVAAQLGYDFSGVDGPQSEGDFYGLRYAEFTVPLVKAVQEQQAQIEALKSENAMLSKQLNEVLSRLNKLEEK